MNVSKPELELAWKRIKTDQLRSRDRRRVFVRHPYEVKLVEVDLKRWLDELRAKLSSGGYRPQPLAVCDAPKNPIATRPGGILALEDRVVFAAAVGLCLPQLIDTLCSNDGVVDFSYQLSVNPTKASWLKNRFECWTSFREECAAALTSKVNFVVVADIAGYYENIDIATLMSDLRTIKAPDDAINCLSSCLNRWAQLHGRSIPQGHSPADILAKLYLSFVDSALRDLGHKHFRFVDDFRFFCHDIGEAKRALVDLERLLRTRGLVLNSSKSQILDEQSAQNHIDGRIPVIEGVRRGIVEKITAEIGASYVDRAQAESILGKPVEEISIDLIENTLEEYFLKGTGFSPSLFHFLLNRLAAGNSKFAVKYCLTLLRDHPEETDVILDYLGKVSDFSELDSKITIFLRSSFAELYPYQIYQILEWLSDLQVPLSNRLLSIVRKLAFEAGSVPYVRAVCIKLLGDLGTSTDLQGLETYYSKARNALEQADVICALRRLENVRRNAFLGRVQNDSEWARRAAIYIKSQN